MPTFIAGSVSAARTRAGRSFEKNQTSMEPLHETDRAVYWDHRGGVGVVLILTLQNSNNFPVTFEANHVRIY